MTAYKPGNIKIVKPPIDTEILCKAENWKYPKKGIIKKDKLYSDIYSFHYQDNKKNNTFIQLRPGLIFYDLQGNEF